MKTYQARPSDIEKKWVLIDADGVVLGRLASIVANRLRGKHKTSYTPHMDCGDHVVVINAGKVELSGKKWTQKVYRRHSQYPGNLKEETAGEVLQKHPERLIERAVRGMLATNRMRNKLLGRLKVYAGSEHPHSAQQPKELF